MSQIDSVDALPARFNAVRSVPRLLMVLSPSCVDCLTGAAIVAAAGATSVLTMWTDMRPEDSADSARRAATNLPDEFLHFWEGEPWPVSTALRPMLGLGPYDATRSAWDVYLFYAPSITWPADLDNPPRPTTWAHNLTQHPGVGARLDAALVRQWFAPT